MGIWGRAKKTPNERLLESAEGGDRDGVVLALSDGADPRVVEEGGTGWGALHFAVAAGEPEICCLLIGAGADIGAGRVHPGSGVKYTALLLSCDMGRSSCMRLLLQAGAIPEPFYLLQGVGVGGIRGGADVDLLASAGADPFHEWEDGFTLMHAAAANGAAEVVETLGLLGVGADPRTGAGDSPMHLAAADGYREAVEALIRLGADTGALNAAGETPLSVASGAAREILEALREADELSREVPEGARARAPGRI